MCVFSQLATTWCVKRVYENPYSFFIFMGVYENPHQKGLWGQDPQRDVFGGGVPQIMARLSMRIGQ